MTRSRRRSELEAEGAALDDAFAALADGTRRAIIERLTHGEATVNELATLSPLTPQAVSRHIGVLRRCGLIEQRVDGQRRPCRLNAARLDEVDGWIGTQRHQWADRLHRLDQHLSTLKTEPQ